MHLLIIHILFQIVYPLQNMKGTFSRLHGVLEDIKCYTQCNEISSGSNSITDALHEAVAMYRRQAQLLNQVTRLYRWLIELSFYE